MKVVTGETISEDKLIKAIQKKLGAVVDGMIGEQTMTDIACAIGADCFPLTVELFGNPVIIAKNAVPFMPKGKNISGWDNVISGSFLSGTAPCSILVADGWTYSEYACHYWYGKPETVIFRRTDGTVGVQRCLTASELPQGVKWAVGGLGLLNYYAPSYEGFCKVTQGSRTEDFSDVLRKTNHTMLGYKAGYFYLAYCKSMTAKQVNDYAKQLGLEYAIMLDGGHVAAINGGEDFAKINLSQRQYYAVQGE